MYIEELNRPVMKLDDAHPAKKFLNAFIECRSDCVGRHHDWTEQTPIEQEWTSAADGRRWTFSGFAYSFISFDIVLDGFNENARELTASELAAIDEVPRLRALMHECAAAAKHDGNTEILELTDQVLSMFGLWDHYVEFRKEWIARSAGCGSG